MALLNELIDGKYEILHGRVQNPAILSFQHRSGEHPHPVTRAG